MTRDSVLLSILQKGLSTEPGPQGLQAAAARACLRVRTVGNAPIETERDAAGVK